MIALYSFTFWSLFNKYILWVVFVVVDVFLNSCHMHTIPGYPCCERLLQNHTMKLIIQKWIALFVHTFTSIVIRSIKSAGKICVEWELFSFTRLSNSNNSSGWWAIEKWQKKVIALSFRTKYMDLWFALWTINGYSLILRSWS